MLEAHMPYWLTVAAQICLALCVLCFLYILMDQQPKPAPMMRVMLWVWPIAALWAGPLGVWAYRNNQKRHTVHSRAEHLEREMKDARMQMPAPGNPAWQSIMAGTLHFGSARGCSG